MRNIRFTVLLSSDERQYLQELAKTLRRSQGDSIRFLLTSWINSPRKTDKPQSSILNQEARK